MGAVIVGAGAIEVVSLVIMERESERRREWSSMICQ